MKKIMSSIYIYLMLFIMYAPILLLIVYSFSSNQYIMLDNYGSFSLKLYGKLFTDASEIWVAFGNTMLIGFSSAIVSTILGTMGAIGIFYLKKRTKKVYTTINQIPVLNAEIITALSLTLLFAKLFKVSFSFTTLLIGHVVLTCPYVVISVLPKLEQMDSSLYEAALDLGAKPVQALFKVVLPDILPGILSGMLLAFTLSLDDYIVTAFTRNDAFTTLSTYVYGVTAKGPLPAELRAFTTIFTMSVALIVLLGSYFLSKKKGLKGVK